MMLDLMLLYLVPPRYTFGTACAPNGANAISMFLRLSQCMPGPRLGIRLTYTLNTPMTYCKEKNRFTPTKKAYRRPVGPRSASGACRVRHSSLLGAIIEILKPDSES